MLKMTEDLEGALETYIPCLERHEYFEAHEVLEEAWHPLRLRKDPLANLVKGFINAAICFEHIKRNKNNHRNKAQRVIASYDRHIHLCTKDIAHYRLFLEAKLNIDTLKIVHNL